MTSDIVSESSHVYLPDKSISSDTSNIFADESEEFIPVVDMSTTSSSYIKTSSPSSITSVSTIDRPSKRRRLFFKSK